MGAVPPPPPPLTGLQRFVYGCLGAASPEIIRWFKISQQSSAVRDIPASILLYLIMGLLFVIVGGAFATAWRDDSPIKNFYLGVTFPIFVAAILAGAPPALPATSSPSVAPPSATSSPAPG